MGASYCGALIGTCIDATIMFAEDVDKQELMAYMRIGQEIIFRVNGFDASNSFIDGLIDGHCLQRIKETIGLSDEYNGRYICVAFGSLDLMICLL